MLSNRHQGDMQTRLELSWDLDAAPQGVSHHCSLTAAQQDKQGDNKPMETLLIKTRELDKYSTVLLLETLNPKSFHSKKISSNPCKRPNKSPQDIGDFNLMAKLVLGF